MNKLLQKIVFYTLAFMPMLLAAQKNKKGAEYYQITVYHFATAENKTVLDDFLQNAYLPALHRQQVKSIGVFTPISNDTAADKRIYTIVPLSTLQQADVLATAIDKDEAYLSAGKTYLEAKYTESPYKRMEVILLKAFPLAPTMILPNLTASKPDHVYELRSYEGATERIFQNKVKMFNEGGEISLFKRLNFNAVFYASVVAGSHMPNLMYMTSFENMTERDAHWKSFGADPEWKKISSMPEYQNNTSKIEITLMKTAAYSDY